MAASLSKNEAVNKFLPVIFEPYRDEIVPVFLASKLASDLSDGLETITFKRAFEKLERTILGISTTSQSSQELASKKVVKVTDKSDLMLNSVDDDENTQIMLIRIDSDEVTQPLNNGTPGSALYSVPFHLNHYPNRTWQQIFLLDGTTIEEVRDYHLRTLKLVIQETNKQYKQLIIKEQQRQERAIVLVY